MTRTRTATVAALASTIGLAAVAWAVAVHRMGAMEMGTATPFASVGEFLAGWSAMSAATMLPSAAPALVRIVRAGRGLGVVPLFIASYLAVWMLVGVAVYALHLPHGPFAAGAVAIGAGLYEITPLKRYFRRRCRDEVRSGVAFGLCCAGSCIGLMLMMAAVSISSVAAMAAIALIVLAQKLLPENAAIDVPLALAIVGFGFLIVVAPSSVPGIMPAM